MITAIRELGTVLGGIKNREKVKAEVEIFLTVSRKAHDNIDHPEC